MRRRGLLLFSFLLCLFLTGCEQRREVRAHGDLDRARLGVLTSLAHRPALVERYPGAVLKNYEDLPSLALALRSGKIDAALCPDNALDAFLKGNPGLAVLPGALLRDSVAVAFRHNETELAVRFNAFLGQMRADGRLSGMTANWFGSDAPRSFYHSHVREGVPLRVGIELGQSGLTVMEGDEETGFEPELMRRFGDEIGRPVHFVEMTGAGMIPALMSGKVDALVDAITPTPQRSANVLFSDPYYRGDLHLVAPDPDAVLSSPNRGLGASLRANLLDDGRYLLILRGLWITLVIMLCSLVLGSLLGALLCWMDLYGPPALGRFARGYCEFIEGIPIVVLLLFMFYVVFAASTATALAVAVVTYSLHFAAGACECFRNGLESVPRGQYEAGQALGFSNFGTLRYVVLPQAARQILLLFKGKSVALIENTSIVGFIALQDLTKVTDIIRTQTYNSLIPLVVVGLLYFLLAKLVGLLIDKLGDYLLK
ncbi:MAG: ABC transporter substrate-binding protein/permease [Bacteroidales bacterium]|nr:ABC transporter substrate-binding protein/permease [Bacteroidales bacterium]